MLYLFIDKNKVKILSLKKSILGQYETNFFSKTFPSSSLLDQGKITNTDFVASAVKEALQSLSSNEIKDKEVLLILPQESYYFLRIKIPSDIAASTIASFVKDKARSNLTVNLEECTYDFTLEESPTEKYIHFFAVENTVLEKYKEALNLIDLKIIKILPETVTYFKLFQKTLRKDKLENIFYVTYDDDQLAGIVYDSYGQSSAEKWTIALEGKKIEEVLKTKVAEFEQKGIKLNRLILAGLMSDKIRQDTFTKEIGVWTNPLKRIIPEFYQDYLKLLINSSAKPFTVFSYEACLGGFIFNQQNKYFSLLNNGKGKAGKSLSIPSVSLPLKEVAIFISSFILSFLFFILVFKTKPNFNLAFLKINSKPTVTAIPVKPTSSPTATPSPKIEKDKINIKILNGSGTAGKAGELKTILKNKGYTEILTGNADNFDFKTSELQVKKSEPDLGPLLKNDLKSSVSAFKESVLDEKDAADVVIIIGSDFQ